MKPFHILTKLILAAGAICGISSCAIVDPEWNALQAKVDRNPTSDALVGLWHRDGTGKNIGDADISILFKRDGTAFYTNQIAKRSFDLTYSYQGNGVWGVFWAPPASNAPYGSVSLAQDRLCWTIKGSVLIFRRQAE